MVPPDDRGHTLVEVWDDALRWVVVDPSSYGYMVTRGAPAAAVDLLANSETVDLRRFSSVAPSASETGATRHYLKRLLTGSLLYPEPWLYLRLGPRVGPWPTRGQYVRAGAAHLTLGPIQHALVVAIPVLGLLGAALVLAGWRRPDALRTPVWTDPQPAPARAVDDLDALPPG
jgi:hypothetical protein